MERPQKPPSKKYLEIVFKIIILPSSGKTGLGIYL
jgi:hypothetical protein